MHIFRKELNCDSPWQEPIERVLAPHFRCITIKYSHYRWLGFLSAVVEPRLLLLGLAILWFVKWRYTIPFFRTLLIGVGILALSCVAARIRQHLAQSHFLAESSRRLPLGFRPHVIAHSMGTKLVGTVLKNFPEVRLGNVVRPSRDKSKPAKKPAARPRLIHSVKPSEDFLADYVRHAENSILGLPTNRKLKTSGTLVRILIG